MTTPRTASNSEARKRLAEKAPKWVAFPGKVPVCRDCGTDWKPVRRGECMACGSDAGPLSQQSGNHIPHWDPAVVQLIEQARAEGAAEVVARVEAALDYDLRDGTDGKCPEPGAWRRGARHVAVRVSAALRGPR